MRGTNEESTIVGWEDINLNLMEGIDFTLKTRNLILPVFDNATNALNEEWKKYENTFNRQIAEAYQRGESEGGMMTQELYWEEDLHRQRLQGVGALALDWLMSSVQVALRGAKTYLDKTHPANPSYSKKEGWLGKDADEYQKRFGIDFKAGPVSFERIQELVLARNAGIRSAFVLSGYGRGEWEHQRDSWRHQPDLISESLLEAVDAIIKI